MRAGVFLGSFYDAKLPRITNTGSPVSGVGDSRKPKLCHSSFSETLYIGLILSGADWGYALTHEQLSGVWDSRKLCYGLQKQPAQVDRRRT